MEKLTINLSPEGEAKIYATVNDAEGGEIVLVRGDAPDARSACIFAASALATAAERFRMLAGADEPRALSDQDRVNAHDLPWTGPAKGAKTPAKKAAKKAGKKGGRK